MLDADAGPNGNRVCLTHGQPGVAGQPSGVFGRHPGGCRGRGPASPPRTLGESLWVIDPGWAPIRLQLAAEESAVPALVIRRWRNDSERALADEPTAAVTRWRISALPSRSLQDGSLRQD